jgi:hypothetical protein
VTPVHGTLQCNDSFALFDAGLALSGTSVVEQMRPEIIGYNKARISIEAPAWNPGTPIVVVVGKKGALSPCTFTLGS